MIRRLFVPVKNHTVTRHFNTQTDRVCAKKQTRVKSLLLKKQNKHSTNSPLPAPSTSPTQSNTHDPTLCPLMLCFMFVRSAYIWHPRRLLSYSSDPEKLDYNTVLLLDMFSLLSNAVSSDAIYHSIHCCVFVPCTVDYGSF